MVKKLKTGIIVQARESSIRFPKKVLYSIIKKPLIIKILERLKKSKLKDVIVVSIPKNKKNSGLESLLINKKYKIYKGHEENVLKRFYDTANKFKLDIIVRITSDCPFTDPVLIDRLINILIKKKLDYASNTLQPTYPDGLDVEVFTFKTLKNANKNAKSKFDREHVTPYIKRKKRFKKFNLKHNKDLSNLRFTVDEKKDIKLVEFVFKNFKNNFNWQKLIKSKKRIKGNI